MHIITHRRQTFYTLENEQRSQDLVSSEILCMILLYMLILVLCSFVDAYNNGIKKHVVRSQENGF